MKEAERRSLRRGAAVQIGAVLAAKGADAQFAVTAVGLATELVDMLAKQEAFEDQAAADKAKMLDGLTKAGQPSEQSEQAEAK